MWLPVAHFRIDPAAPGSKTYLPSTLPNVCRFCGRAAPAAAFSKDAPACASLARRTTVAAPGIPKLSPPPRLMIAYTSPLRPYVNCDPRHRVRAPP
jgi:hypothetical protein